jgi:cyclopropane fatty-acyl-phospholipid synthase-like methyltransferase
LDGGPGDPDDAAETLEAAAGASPEPRQRLHDRRLDRVADELKALGAASVLDLGCGSGKLLARLLKVRRFTRICGVDASSRELEIAAERLHLLEMTPQRRERISLLHGALTYRDQRIVGFDAAAIVEVIEHIDPPRLDSLADAVFCGFQRIAARHSDLIAATIPI